MWSPQVALCDYWMLGTLKDWDDFTLPRVLGALDSVPEKEDFGCAFMLSRDFKIPDTGVIDFSVQGFRFSWDAVSLPIAEVAPGW